MSTATARFSPFVPLDAARRLFLRALGPLGRAMMRDRELRVAVMGAVAVTGCLVTTVAVPLWLLALGPFVWGVAHLVADVRYLVLRPGFHRRPALWFAAGLPLAAAGLGAGTKAGALAVAGAVLVSRAPLWKKSLGVALSLSVAALAWRAGWYVDLAFAHLHNLVAVLAWWVYRPRARSLHLAPLGLFVAGLGLILTGALDPVVDFFRGLEAAPGGMDLYYQCVWLAPSVPVELATRVVLSFAFAQGVHYAIWTRLVPEEDRARPTPRTFSATWRALVEDFGRAPLYVALAVALGLAAWAVWDLASARIGYFRLALFHGHLELAALALFWAEGRARTSP